MFVSRNGVLWKKSTGLRSRVPSSSLLQRRKPSLSISTAGFITQPAGKQLYLLDKKRGFSGHGPTTALRASTLAAPPEAFQTDIPKPRLLSKLVSAHAASVTALYILTDTYEDKKVVSASLDKSLCTWRLTSCKQPLPPGTIPSPNMPPPAPLLDELGHTKLEVQVVRLKAPRSPVFSFVRQPSPAPNGSVFSPTAEVLFCGNAAKEMFAWEVRPCLLDDPCPANFQMVATEYSGWVRSLAIMGKWLISCGCNCLRQHDTSFPLPKEVSNIEQAFKGDILTIAASSNRVFAGCADGCLRSWKMNSKSGALTLSREAQGAHSSRITGLALQGPHLYSISLDCSIRVWRTQDLVCVAEVKAAHDGKKIHAIAVGPDDIIYTGGDDKLIRRWKPLSTHPAFVAENQPPSAPTPISPSTSINAATGEVTSTLPSSSDSDDVDSRDCDLGGTSTVPSRDPSPPATCNGLSSSSVAVAAAAAAAATTNPDGSNGRGSSSSSSSNSSEGEALGSKGDLADSSGSAGTSGNGADGSRSEGGLVGSGSSGVGISSSGASKEGSTALGSSNTANSDNVLSNGASSISAGSPSVVGGGGSAGSAGTDHSGTGSAHGNGSTPDDRGSVLLELQPAPGAPLSAHDSGLRCLAAGPSQCLVSGDSNGDLCIWALPVQPQPVAH